MRHAGSPSWRSCRQTLPSPVAHRPGLSDRVAADVGNAGAVADPRGGPGAGAVRIPGRGSTAPRTRLRRIRKPGAHGRQPCSSMRTSSTNRISAEITAHRVDEEHRTARERLVDAWTHQPAGWSRRAGPQDGWRLLAATRTRARTGEKVDSRTRLRAAAPAGQGSRSPCAFDPGAGSRWVKVGKHFDTEIVTDADGFCVCCATRTASP